MPRRVVLALLPCAALALAGLGTNLGIRGIGPPACPMRTAPTSTSTASTSSPGRKLGR